MKKLITFLILCLPLALFAQEANQCSGSYDSNNNPNGLWTCYYAQDSVVWKKTNFSAGVLQGTSKEYYSNTQLKLEANYTNGVLDGSVKEYYSGGQLKYEGSFSNGNPIGIHKDYDENGTVTSEHDFGN